MNNMLREVWCRECAGLSLIGGTPAVVALVGVDRRTIHDWHSAGQVHAPAPEQALGGLPLSDAFSGENAEIWER